MDRNLQITRAINFASAKHITQTDKSGVTYVFHPIGVARRAAMKRAKTEVVVAAILHDVVEDCGVPLGEIVDMFGAEVARLVQAISRDPKTETYAEFIQRIIRAGKDAILLKICDTEDNLDPDRSEKLSPQERAFLHKRYGKSLPVLQEAYDAA